MTEMKKLILGDLLNPFIKKETVQVMIPKETGKNEQGEPIIVNEEHSFDFGIRPPSDAFNFARIEVMERIQDELKMDDEQFEKFEDERQRRMEKIKEFYDKEIAKLENPTPEDKLRLMTEANARVKYSTLDRKYNVRWNKYMLPIQIRFLVVNEAGEPLFKNDDEILNLPVELRQAISEKVNEYLLKEQMGSLDAKK